MVYVFGRRLVDQCHEGTAADTNTIAVDFSIGAFPDLKRLGIAKIDPDVLDDPHGQIVNLLDSLCVYDFIQGNIRHQRRVVDNWGVDPRGTARRATPFAGLFLLLSDHSTGRGYARGRPLSGS